MRKKAPVAPELAPVEQPIIVQAPVEELAQPEPVVEPEPEPAPPPAPPEPPAPVEALAAFAARIEELAQPLAVCQITHPDAVHGAIHVGKYAGIRLVRGDTVQALLSDGSTL